MGSKTKSSTSAKPRRGENAVFLIIALILAGVGLYWSWILFAGQTTEAAVVSSTYVRKNGSQANSFVYSVTYRFAAEGQSYTGSGYLVKNRYGAGTGGVTIKYLAGHPSSNLLASGQPWSALLWLVIGILLFVGNTRALIRKNRQLKLKQPAASPASVWHCPCGRPNSGAFCPACGFARPTGPKS